MSDIVKVTLGDKEFKIGGLTIRQARDLRVGDASLPKDDGAGGWSNVYDLSVKTIAIGTGVPEEELWKLSGVSEDQIAAARKAILKKAGFMPEQPTIAELRSTVAAKKNELAELEKALVAAEQPA